MKKIPVRKKSKGQELDLELVRDLLEQKKRYEFFFEHLPHGEIDNSAQSAYMGIVKTLHDINRKLQAEGHRSPEELKEIAREILENEYGVRLD